ncbi:glycosyltransferase [Duganella sp. FT3S]|uniref:Glycosyltransferase n=1 Tax=Rugamonas fusca TaxID=2758568 RepID=A0A7W2EKJ8_9BURK|nr:glycosyltransferase [Rugamonas fusca]MBA5607591.1 glycosyltransferase [Rugamonas fusca]
MKRNESGGGRVRSIAMVLRDPLPPTRADVLTLFGVELARHGLRSQLIGQAGQPGARQSWAAGAIYAHGHLRSRWASVLSPWWDVRGLWQALTGGPIDCIQVRDKIAVALLCRLIARVRGLPFVYWMSFPMVEGFEVRRDEIASRGRGLLWCAHAARAWLARRVFYGQVLPAADHVFVQSEAMADWLAGLGLARARMTSVPMGVDAALFNRDHIAPSTDPRLDGRRVLIYLGALSKSRNSAFLLDLVDLLRHDDPRILMVLAGDAPSDDERRWMRAQIADRGLAQYVLLTGWLPQREALAYAVRAEVGLSPIPRGRLFDVSSPTKLVEYLALGLPSVANDIPDQQLVMEQSGSGLCVAMELPAFRAGVLRLLADPELRARYAQRGPAYVRAHRTYAILGRQVAAAYARILAPAA